MKTIGIYKITNLLDKKVYIGQSWGIQARWSHHKKHSTNAHLRAAIEKYGLNNFEFSILREFTESPLTNIFLTTFEQKFIDEYDSRNSDKGYNFKEAGPQGKHSEESKLKMHTPEWRQKVSKALTGRVISPEWRQKISKAKKGKPFTEKQQAKADAQKGKKMSVEWCIKNKQSKIDYYVRLSDTEKENRKKQLKKILSSPARRQLQSENMKAYWAKHKQEIVENRRKVREKRTHELVATNLDSNSAEGYNV